MKRQATDTETAGRAAAASSARADQSRRSGERVSISPLLSDPIRPLLAGFGIEVLEPDTRNEATLRVESAIAEEQGSAGTGRIRVEHVSAGAQQPDRVLEFEPPGFLPGASYIISYVFGINPPLLTADAAMFAVIRAAVRAGQVDSPMLVSGETGTGKELLVRLIHAASNRAGKINSVNCAALNESVPPSRTGHGEVSSESAFPNPGDEIRLREFCAAADTTLFLDQVSELSPAAQAWVLHVLTQAGETQDREDRSGARLVCATNRPLAPMVLTGEFKRELCDRIAVVTLSVPPLRQRRADIAMLANGFLNAEAPHLRFTPGALKLLNSYPFPGNVRELHNLVTRLTIMRSEGAGPLIHPSDLRPELAGAFIAPSIWNTSSRRMGRDVAIEALVAYGGDRAAAARALGISVRALEEHVGASQPPFLPRPRPR